MLMRVWRFGGNCSSPRYDVMIQPGKQHPETSDFMDEKGEAKFMTIPFIFGQTDELPDGVAQYLIDNGLAQDTRFILPE